jgi:hypothetical protein
MASTVLRQWARTLVRYAASNSPDRHANDVELPLIHLNHIGGDVEALFWAVGCVWSVRAERAILTIHPAANCVLLFVGLYLFVDVLAARLAWYGVPPLQFEFPDETIRGFAKFGMFIICVGLVALVSPGCARRRIFAAALFPFVGLMGLWVTGLATAFAVSIQLPDEYLIVETILRGLTIGFFVAWVLSVPTALLYGAVAGPIAALALVPSIAKASWNAAHPYMNLDASGGLFWFGWPSICAIIFLAISTNRCHRWLRVVAPEKPHLGGGSH